MSNLINSYSLSSVIGIGTDTPNQNLTVVGGISSNALVYDATGNSSKWNSVYTNVNANSGTYATTGYVASNYLNLTGGNITGNLNIYGNVSAQGTSYFANTIFTTTSALCAVANSAGPALFISQLGAGDIASFYDFTPAAVEVLHIGASVGTPYVGIYTSFPNVELTVNGSISSNQIIYVNNGNSNNWNSSTTTLNANSATWVTYTALNTVSGNWQNTYTTVSSNSASWVNTTTTTNTNSANWSNWSTVSSNYAVGSQYVKLSGDNMTGSLSASGNISTASTVYTTYLNKNKTNTNVALIGYNFSSLINSLASTASPSLAVSTVAAGLMTRATGINGFASTVGWGSTNYFVTANDIATALANTEYYTIPIYSTASDTITITSISPFICVRSPAGPRNIGLLFGTSSNPSLANTISTGSNVLPVDSINTDIASTLNAGITGNNITITPGTTGYFFLVPYGATGNGGTLRYVSNSVNDLSFTGTVYTGNYTSLTIDNNIIVNNNLTVSNDFEITYYNKFIMKSPNGNRWRISVTDAGVLSAVLI
tara:strand:- start:319 stop:1944 length:1626 start_codon:yes stop_codon:yes gene_type:complete